MINGLTNIILTKLDVLSGFKKIKVATAYKVDGEEIDYFPSSNLHMAKPIYILLIPIEVLGMFVKPFALTMRLAANMTGGHIAILAVLSLVFLFTEMANAWMGMAVAPVSVALAVGISGLELIVVLVQAYVFTLLSAVFIGLVIHVHH